MKGFSAESNWETLKVELNLLFLFELNYQEL